MSSTYVLTGITIALALHSMTDAFRMKITNPRKEKLFSSTTLDYRRPICAPEQTCSYEAFGMIFALCDCPGKMSACPREEENAIQHRGTLYNFCSARNVPNCEDGEISTVVAGIQTAIHCICSDDSELIQQTSESKDVTNYICRQKRPCIIEEVCGLKSFVGEKRLCECPTATSCVYPRSTVTSLTHQIGRCYTH